MNAFAKLLLDAKAVSIRDINGGEQPFLYSSGNYGPGYVMVKGLVGRRMVLDDLVYALSRKLLTGVGGIQFIAANATGGMIPGWMLAENLAKPYVYVRGTRKKGGHKELVTGAANNDEIKKGDNALGTRTSEKDTRCRIYSA